MLEFIQKIDQEIFLFLNGLHSPIADPVMQFLTNQLVWTPLFILVIYTLFKKYGWSAVWNLAGIGLIILVSDQFVSGFMKPFFGRLRPSHDPELQTLVHFVNEYKGGLYGFASSHAANSFGVALYLWIVAKKEIKWIWIMFGWAFIFSYTRIYLGVHYPADILVGASVGCVFALAIDWLIRIARNIRSDIKRT